MKNKEIKGRSSESRLVSYRARVRFIHRWLLRYSHATFVCHSVQETTGVHSVTHLLRGCAGSASSLGAVLWFAQQLKVSAQEVHYAAAPLGGLDEQREEPSFCSPKATVTTCSPDSANPLSSLQRHVFSHYVSMSAHKGGFLGVFSALCKSISHQLRINLIA